ncbi:unnamed protein product [Bathycoccus prasinos]
MENDRIALQALAEHQFSCNAVKAFEELTLLHRRRKELEDRNRKGEANLARKATVARKFTAASAAEGAFRKCTNTMMPELLSLWDAKLERGELDIHAVLAITFIFSSVAVVPTELCFSKNKPLTGSSTVLILKLAKFFGKLLQMGVIGYQPLSFLTYLKDFYCSEVCQDSSKLKGGKNLRRTSVAVAFLNPTVKEKKQDSTVNEPATSSSPSSSAAPKKSADQKITTGKYIKVAQYSFGIQSGASKAVLRVKSVMELNPSWVSVSIDMKNVFNSVDLDYMFKVWADEIARAPPRSSARYW